MARKRILTDIVENIENYCGKEICSNKSRGWNVLKDIKITTGEFATKSVQCVQNCCETRLYPPKDFKDDYIKQEFSISWRKKEKVKSQKALIGVTENNLETFIMLAQKPNENDTWINQVPVPNGHIDIYRDFEEQLYIYELKIWDNGKNTPIYSVIEAIKNYKLLPVKENKKVLEKFSINIDKFKTVNLIILAPMEYFVRYNKPDSVKTFFEYIKALEKELKASYGKTFKIILQAIDFKQADYKQFCDDLITDINKKQPNRIYRGMSEFNGKWKNYFNLLPKKVQENLNCKNWKTISSVTEWTILKN